LRSWGLLKRAKLVSITPQISFGRLLGFKV